MRRPLIVYIDTLGVGLAESLAVAARRRGVAVAVICPKGTKFTSRRIFARVIETRSFALETLRKLLQRFDRYYRVRGVHTLFGAYRSDGFLHASVAQLAAERGLSHSPAIALAAATNKFIARFLFASAGVPDIPYGFATDEASIVAIARKVSYPVVIKPVTGTGSSHIYRCENDSDARKYWRRAVSQLPRAHYEQLRMAPHTFQTPQGAVMYFNPTRAVLVERYLAGREASVECIVVGDKVTTLVVHDKLSVEEKTGFVLEHLLVAPPARFTAAEVRKLREHAAQAVRAIGLRNTFCHVELRWVDGLGPRILEVNSRIGAGCVTDSVETFTNLDVDETRAMLILGKPPRRIKRRKARRHAMVFLFTPHSGRLARLDGIDDLLDFPGVQVVRTMHSVGDRVGGDTEEGFLASIWLEARNEDEARRAFAQIRAQVRIEVT
jgi:biotin carboxylase